MKRNINNVIHIAECSQGWVKKQGEETSLVCWMFLETWRSVLSWHENHERHVKVMRNGGECQRVVRVNDQECWTSSEGEEISWIKATVFFVLSWVLADWFHISLGTHQHSAHVIACVLRPGSVREASVSWYVEKQSSSWRQLFVTRGEEHHQLGQTWFVEQILVRVVSTTLSESWLTIL